MLLTYFNFCKFIIKVTYFTSEIQIFHLQQRRMTTFIGDDIDVYKTIPTLFSKRSRIITQYSQKSYFYVKIYYCNVLSVSTDRSSIHIHYF